MTRKILPVTIFAVLAYGFWVSPDFKTIAAGVAIFLLGMYALEEGFKAVQWRCAGKLSAEGDR